MCGRMTLTVPDLSAVADLIEARIADAAAAAYQPRYNAAPSDLCFIAREFEGRRLLVPARWGFPGARGELIINARSETAAKRSLFREAVARRRCVVPADGFYEWTGPRDDRRPLWFHLGKPARDGAAQGVFFFAALYDEALQGPQAGPPRFAVLTTAANGLVTPVHDRMPVILDPAQARKWLAGPDESLLAPAPDALLAATEVSPRVNSVSNDDPACLAPQPPRAREQPAPNQLRLL